MPHRTRSNSAIDETRAWTEIETLFAHQWPDGMVPHIVFHVYSDGYFPGPNMWDTKRPTADLGHHPTARRRLCRQAAVRSRHRQDRQRRTARTRCCRKSTHWHRWFYEMRDPQSEGWSPSSIRGEIRVATIPSTGTRPSSACPPTGIEPYVRRDTQHADPAHRPTKAQYDRYLWLVQLLPLAGLGQFQAARRVAVQGGRPRLQRHPDPLGDRPRGAGRGARRARDCRRPTATRAQQGACGAGDAVERGAWAVSVQGPGRRVR